ncbi:pyridine nucleotide-disulfide oxidoreductase domain-containing protein 2-like [Saccoglossus kowalevskii]|uniref:Pyridine nucleotide-disulfide oxidoreductase domain-containing protein 2 n=1 Tax=Saccoglossus kowalevskii TaxID=10224 RepID=A0ABM0MRR9_SACKO|nr:PREDICTED: pyridine nucleotide-disulfide oxidoreductase domain-containing protein 2-like [Saccoglossus kowalevskii]
MSLKLLNGISLLKIQTLKSAFRTFCVASTTYSKDVLKEDYDAVIIGGGHNGLVTAAYLQKNGLKTLVLERRHLIGGAAVTEEIIPGFKFSRASYVLSLLRPQIYKDLELKKHGLKVYLREQFAFTPVLDGKNSYLLLGNDKEETFNQIAKFSEKDAKAYFRYEKMISKIAESIEPLLDNPPVDIPRLTKGTFKQKLRTLPSIKALFSLGVKLSDDISSFYELITSPTTKILDHWFESEPLKATLATDAVIGAMLSPTTPGSGYVLLHHVMGEIEGIKGAWGYPEGGMGAVSGSIAKAALSYGATILTEQTVEKILLKSDGSSAGVRLKDGTEIKSRLVFSNATPKVTFCDLVPRSGLSQEFFDEINKIDYTSPVTKINVAVDRLPNFTAIPNNSDGSPSPHHSCTIHLNCESMQYIDEAYNEALQGEIPTRPMIEMVIPSSCDPTIAPPGSHVISLFTQYTPYTLKDGKEWDDTMRNNYADKIFDVIEQYAPGFKSSVVGRDILTPPDLERIFGLTGGNIFHGAMSLDQLYLARPSYRSPIAGLYLCGSGGHPGGGVMGAPGKNAAMTALQDMK